MAPSLHMLPDVGKAQLKGLKRNKIRKPVIEKMRRDRINSSIEQLRILLEKDIQTHHPHSKLEKADILEMAVNYLQQQRQYMMNSSQLLQRRGHDSYYHGFYMCLKETVGFLHNQETTPSGKTGEHICRNLSQAHSEQYLDSPHTSPQQRVSCQPSPCNTKIWRPW